MSRKTRKLIWSAPLVAVLAVAGALAVFVMLTPDEAAADERAGHGPPGAVTGLDATTAANDPSTHDIDGQTMIELSWYAPNADATGAATSYRIDVSRDTRVWHALEASVSDAAADTNCGSGAADGMRCDTHDMLMPDTTYYYRVFAMNAQGISGVSVNPTYDFDTTEAVANPSPVRNLTATTHLQTQINLDWDVPLTDGGGAIVKYCIQVSSLEEAFPDLSDITNTDLSDACQDAEESSEAPSVSMLTNDASSDDDVQTIVVGAGSTSYMHTGLIDPDEIALRYRLYAVTDADDEDKRITLAASNTATGRTVTDRLTPTDPLAKPTAVQNLRAVTFVPSITELDETPTSPEMRLYWNAPAGRDTIHMNWNRIEVHKWVQGDGRYEWQLVTGRDLVATDTPAQFVIDMGDDATSLVEGNPRNERYRVRYVIDPDGSLENDGDDGNPDETDDEVYGEPREVRVALPLEVKSDADTSREDARQDQLPLLAVPAPENGYDLDETPTPDQTVASRNLRFRHNIATPITAINLHWQRNKNMDEDDDENLPTGYVIDVSEDEGTTWLRLANADAPSDLGSTTRYIHRNVKPGDKYTYRVFPWHKNAFGIPQVIDASSQEADLPNPVRGLRVTDDGQSKLVLTWPAVTVHGGHEIDGYLVQVSNDTNNDDTNDNKNGTTGALDGQWTSLGIVAEDPATDIEYQPWTVAPGTGTLTYTYEADDPATEDTDESLTAGAARWFRVIAITEENDGDEMTGGTTVAADPAAAAAAIEANATVTPNVPGGMIVEQSHGEISPEPEDITSAEEVRGVTEGAPEPDPEADPSAPPAPVDLTAEKATDTNEFALTDRGVLLLWNEPAGGSVISAYEIERKIDDGAFEFIGQVTWTGDGDSEERTSFTDPRNPEAGEMLEYRVGSRSTSVGQVTWAADPVMYPAEHPHGFSAPTNVAATSTGGTITVMWTPGALADSQVIVVVNRADTTDFCAYPDISGTLASYDCENLTVGATYVVLVIALDGQGGYMLGNVETHVAQ